MSGQKNTLEKQNADGIAATENLSPDAALAAIGAIRSVFALRLAAGQESPGLTTELANILRLLAEVDFSDVSPAHLVPSRHPVISHLRGLTPPATDMAADDPTGASAIFRAFLPILADLPWRYSYKPRADAPDIGQRMAWAELVGPIAPFSSHHVCLGITAMDANLCYPAHRHPAVETYLVLHGTANWTAAGITRACPPGALILHPASIVHAMQATDTPLLAAYAWTGEIETLSSYV
jgi:mannose-6-phosphate isomerase-like protein (cupin superfamily)